MRNPFHLAAPPKRRSSSAFWCSKSIALGLILGFEAVAASSATIEWSHTPSSRAAGSGLTISSPGAIPPSPDLPPAAAADANTPERGTQTTPPAFDPPDCGAPTVPTGVVSSSSSRLTVGGLTTWGDQGETSTVSAIPLDIDLPNDYSLKVLTPDEDSSYLYLLAKDESGQGREGIFMVVCRSTLTPVLREGLGFPVKRVDGERAIAVPGQGMAVLLDGNRILIWHLLYNRVSVIDWKTDVVELYGTDNQSRLQIGVLSSNGVIHTVNMTPNGPAEPTQLAGLVVPKEIIRGYRQMKIEPVAGNLLVASDKGAWLLSNKLKRAESVLDASQKGATMLAWRLFRSTDQTMAGFITLVQQPTTTPATPNAASTPTRTHTLNIYRLGETKVERIGTLDAAPLLGPDANEPRSVQLFAIAETNDLSEIRYFLSANVADDTRIQVGRLTSKGWGGRNATTPWVSEAVNSLTIRDQNIHAGRISLYYGSSYAMAYSFSKRLPFAAAF